MSNNEPDYEDNLYFETRNKTMTDSRNTTNEQQNDLCIIDDTLTDGYHYAVVFDKERIIEKKKDLQIPYCDGFCCDNYQYLAPVPSYNEWKEKQKSLKVLAEEYCKEKNQNAQLKELLKEVYVAINEGSYFDQCDILKKIEEVLK